jgi:colanic acid biosynthesis glycosyl transferase WcaI
LGQKQGLETIVEVAQILNISAPYIQFIISGDGAGREAMVKQAEGLNNITFVPLQPFEDFLHLMVAADMHLLPQKAGAADLVMPSKLGNILSSGRPVIVGAPQGTQVHSAIEECGLAVEPENATEFADAILTLAKDEKERELMGKAARARAERDWGKESLLKRMESLLKN